MTGKVDEKKVIHLAVSPRLAGLIKQAVVIESEGPRRDDHTDDEIEMLERVAGEIDGQLAVR